MVDKLLIIPINLSKEIIKRSNLRNKYLKSRLRKIGKDLENKEISVYLY